MFIHQSKLLPARNASAGARTKSLVFWIQFIIIEILISYAFLVDNVGTHGIWTTQQFSSKICDQKYLFIFAQFVESCSSSIISKKEGP